MTANIYSVIFLLSSCSCQSTNLYLCTPWVPVLTQIRLQSLEMRRQSVFGMVHTYSVFMNLRNFVCNIGEDAELLMSLYDPDQSEFIRLALHPSLNSTIKTQNDLMDGLVATSVIVSFVALIYESRNGTQQAENVLHQDVYARKSSVCSCVKKNIGTASKRILTLC